LREDHSRLSNVVIVEHFLPNTILLAANVFTISFLSKESNKSIALSEPASGYFVQ